MKATELRIGNLVKDRYDLTQPILIESLDKKGINLSAGHDGKPYGMHIPEIEYEFLLTEIYGIPLTEEWLVKFGFEEKPAYQWHGNGFDYQIPAEEGGSTTEFRDFVLYLKNDDSFIVRFTSYRWHVYNEDKSISFHLCEWHEKCHEEIICFDTSKVHCLQNAFHLSAGEELEPKKA